MTDPYQERAEKIVDLYGNIAGDEEWRFGKLKDLIAAGIEAAIDAEYAGDGCHVCCRCGQQNARTAALEECAKIADKHALYWAKAKFDVDEGSDRDEYFGKQSASQQIAEDIRHRAKIGEK